LRESLAGREPPRDMRLQVYVVALGLLATSVVGCREEPKLSSIDPVGEPDRLQPSTPVRRLEPGTRIGDRPPAGWSNLVLKTRPRVTSGDLAKVSASLLKAIPNFSTTVVVHVEPDPARPGRFRLAAFAAGMGTPVDGEDVIVTRETAEKLGISFGFMEKMVLRTREKELDDIVSLALAETIGIADFPAIMLRGSDRGRVVMRYATLVDESNGRITTFLWLLDPTNDGYRFSGDTLLEVTQNQISDLDVDVDADEFFLGVPSPAAFAVTSLPQGTPLAAPPELREPAAAKLFSAHSLARFEQLLRKVVAPR
jgi:hypothetical protein